MSPERESEILDAYRRYRNVWHTAHAVMASPNTIRRIARAAGVLRPWGNKCALPSGPMLVRLVRVHGSHAAVARIFGCHPNTIRNRMYGRNR